MLVNEWVESFWTVLNVRPKTLHDYKRLYKRHLAPSIGAYEIDAVPPMVLQQKLLSLPPQTSRHCLMLVKTIYRESKLYGVCVVNPAAITAVLVQSSFGLAAIESGNPSFTVDIFYIAKLLFP